MNNTRLEFIDFAKGFAIIAIVLFHYLIPFSVGIQAKAIMIGGSGVHLFFMLSGYGLGLSKFNLTYGEFLKKRFTKILLPYYIAVTLIFIVNYFYKLYTYENNFYAYAGHILLFKMFDSTIMESYGAHFWFISTIVQFYLIYPLIIFFRERMSARHFVLISFYLSAFYWILISLFGVSSERVFNGFFLQYLWEFNIGYILAEKFKENGFIFWDKKLKYYLLLAATSYLLVGLMVIFGGAIGRTFNDLPSLIGITSLACLVFGVPEKFKLLPKFIGFVGTISYEVYLIHLLIFMLTTSFFSKVNYLQTPLLQIFISLTLTLACAYLFSKLNKIIFKQIYG